MKEEFVVSFCCASCNILYLFPHMKLNPPVCLFAKDWKSLQRDLLL